MEYALAKRSLVRVQIDTSEIDVVNASCSSTHHKPEVKNGRLLGKNNSDMALELFCLISPSSSQLRGSFGCNSSDP